MLKTACIFSIDGLKVLDQVFSLESAVYQVYLMGDVFICGVI